MRRALLAVLALAACVAGPAAAEKVVTFSNGRAAVTLPDAFIANEQNDGTLRASFGPAGENRLELFFREAVPREGATSTGEEYVRALAKAKNFKFFESPGKVVLMEPVADVKDGDRTYRSLKWTIGFGNNVVTMSLRAPAQASPELVEFLQKTLSDVIDSLRRQSA